MEAAVYYTGIRRPSNKSQKDQILREHIEQSTPISQLARKNGIDAIWIPVEANYEQKR
jgi:hypothetical protein